jgi:EmrB/QacA subfamily drug resistance transporter
MQDGGDVAQQQGGSDGVVVAPPTGDGLAAGAELDSPSRGRARGRFLRGRGGKGSGAAGAETGPPGAAGAETGPRSTWILVVCCVAQFMVILDLSIVNVALPSIQSALNFSSNDLQWVVDAYAITFASFLMLGGRVADHLGQRRTFTGALILFSLTSLAGGLAPSSGLLIVARGVQGFSCAFMAASSLAIITSSFPPGPRLHRAIGLWAAMNGAGGAAGTLLGGVITQELSWRWVLLINPPIGIAAAVVAYAVVTNRRRSPNRSFDLAGAATLTVGQVVLVYGVVKAGVNGWGSLQALGPIIAGLALLAAFGVIEARLASDPLVPFKALTRPLRVANTVVLLFSAALFPMWFLSSLYLQQVLGLSPLHTGLTFLPMTLMIMLVASRAGALVSRFGVRAVLGGGLIMMTAGMLLFTKIAASGSSIVYVMIPGLLTAAGIGMSIVPSTIAATQGAKEGQTGLASGLVNTSRQIGGGLGLAVLITLATQHSTHLIGIGRDVPQSLTDGFRLAYLIGAGLTAAAGLVTFVAVSRSAQSKSSTRRLQMATGVLVVVAVFVAVDFAFGGSRGAPIGAYTTRDTYSFVSEPGLHPPVARAAVVPKDLNQLPQGYIFMANFFDLSRPPIAGQSGPMIYDNHLAPVWFRPVPVDVVASNLARQTYEGKPALSWWQGELTNAGATTSGEDVVVNQHYQQIATVKGADRWIPTLHELVIRGNHAWVTANKNIPIDLSKYGGAYNGALIDSAVQEYDLPTGKLLYSWDALDHIPLSDSYASLPTNGFPWDAYHVNAIDLKSDGTFVVSMRNTWAAYQVDRSTSKIRWTLGGKHSTFRLGSRADFSWQHDVTLHPDSTLTMFDDHCCQITGGGTYVSPTAPSRGLTLKLDQTAHTATLATEYSHGASFDADYMGSAQPLRNGNTFIGWGSQPFFSEYSPQGKLIFDAVLPRPDLSYRATVEQWVGLPLYPPAGAARASGGKTTVYASWNGATQVAAWRVLGGSSASALTPLESTAKSGFETAIAVRQSDHTFKLQALDANGRVIGTSRPFGVGR